MKSFKNRVISHLLREGWNIKHDVVSPIDFLSVRPHSHIAKAYRVKSHGHLKRKEQEALCEYGRAHKIHVLYIHETAGHELEFIRLYPKTQKIKAI